MQVLISVFAVLVKLQVEHFGRFAVAPQPTKGRWKAAWVGCVTIPARFGGDSGWPERPPTRQRQRRYCRRRGTTQRGLARSVCSTRSCRFHRRLLLRRRAVGDGGHFFTALVGLVAVASAISTPGPVVSDLAVFGSRIEGPSSARR